MVNFDGTDIYIRTGTVNRSSGQVTLQGGNRFSLNWKAGSSITINGTEYKITSVVNETAVTLEGSPAGQETNVSYSSSNFGVLLRKKTSASTPLRVQYAHYSLTTSNGPGWDSSGAGEASANCSLALTPGPGGEQGWHCQISNLLYWIGHDSGKVNLLGSAKFANRAGADGWQGGGYCSSTGGAFWDKSNPNVLYCAHPDNQGSLSIVRATYRGQNADLGTLGFSDSLPECSNNPQPCWDLENLTPGSQGKSLGTQMAAFHPDWPSFKTYGLVLVGQQGPGNRLVLRAYRDNGDNDLLAFYVVFDLATALVNAATPSWKYWPMRWAPFHGGGDIHDPSWTYMPATFFRGPFTGQDTHAGNGPYYSKIASGPVTATGEACPARPVDSPIPASEWPSGNVCLNITVDGEPGDPSPGISTAGTVSTSGSAIAGSGVSWTSFNDGNKVRIAGDPVFYNFHFLSSTSGTLSPAPAAPVSGASYVMYLEEVNNPKTGSARNLSAYLQDADVRDIFCGRNEPTPTHINGCGFFFDTEYFRLVLKSGNSWTLERGWTNFTQARQEFRPLNANAYLITTPGSCDFTPPYPCGGKSIYWDSQNDRFGFNTSKTGIVRARSDIGGHGLTRPGGEVAAVTDKCIPIDNQATGCYGIRIGPIPQLFTSVSHMQSSNPPFAGKVGIGAPNTVDSHPSTPYSLSLGTTLWFLDARPMLGQADISGTSSNPAVAVEGTLYKFTALQLTTFRPKVLPTMAACGVNPLLDVSSPTVALTGAPEDAYKYCAANAAGECHTGSQQGDVFFNCPQLSKLYCTYPGIGTVDADLRDVCISDMGVYTQALTQVGLSPNDLTGKYGRPITKGFGRYKWNDVFWNAKSTPDGKWMLFRTLWAQDFRQEAFLAKLPSFPAPDGVNRTEFIPVPVKIAAPAGAGATNAVVEFGYTPEFYCTSRREACWKGTPAGITFASENPAGIACATGCQIDIPALAQKVLYYRVRYRNASNQTVDTREVHVLATP